MRLKKIIDALGVETNVEDAPVSFITDDSRKAAKDCVFVCIKGGRFDGHSEAARVLEKGAAAVVVQRDLGLKNQIIVEDSRKAYARICSIFFGRPEKKLKTIGVTGTNGKTTVCFAIKAALEYMGFKTCLIGTIKNVVGDKEYPSSLTTPDCFELFSLLDEAARSGCEYCVMEVSSQALAQSRAEGINFSAAVFTNLTRDHLDYHGTFENYREAKGKLFENAALSVINADDAAAEYMLSKAAGLKATFSIKNDNCDYSAKNIKTSADGVQYELVSDDNIDRVNFKVPGEFSVYNSMCAAVCLIELGMDFKTVTEALASFEGVPGRMEVVPADVPYSVIIDYAHTPDGLENVLKCVREITEGKVIVAFGCGGDRDATKRPIMGEIASRLADAVIVTSDNPRSEDPNAIIKDITAGIVKRGSKIIIDADRESAIEKALALARAGDAVVLAGKGQETCQILASGKVHMDEREIVARILSKKAVK